MVRTFPHGFFLVNLSEQKKLRVIDMFPVDSSLYVTAGYVPEIYGSLLVIDFRPSAAADSAVQHTSPQLYRLDNGHQLS